MKTAAATAVFAVFVIAGAYGVFCMGSHPGPAGTEPAGAQAAAAGRGEALGAFDPAMSGPCRFSCAASQPYEAAEVVAQPGVQAGALTQCPVSGVVFTVDEERPHVKIETGDYVLCCDGCAQRFQKDPARYVSL